jgi:RNA polymerase sigma-70 factor (ECF subfamily)
MVATHRASRIGRALWREWHIFGRSPLSLDRPLSGDDSTVVGDLFSQDQGLGALFGQTFDPADEITARVSLDAGLSALDVPDQDLCAALVTSTIDQLATSGHGARASLYRRLKNVRLALLAHGVEAA